MKNKLIKIIYAFSLSPLIFGSITFFYWYYNRKWFATDVNIELTALFTILAYLFFGLIAIILCSVYLFKQKYNWKKIINPVILLLITLPTVELYSSIYTSFEQKAFVNIVNDVNDTDIIRIRSENFEDTYFGKSKDFIFSYYPVYTYDWTQEISSDWYNYDLNKLIIEIKMKNDSIQTFDFPTFLKGQCGTVRISEIIQK